MILFPTEAENAYLKAWVESRLKAPLGECRCLGVLRNDSLIAVAAFHNYRVFDKKSGTIEVSFAADSPRWATRQMLTWIFSYPFVQLKVSRVSALVKRSNRKARRLLEGVGFKHEGTHPHAAQDREAVLSYGLTRNDFMKRYFKNGSRNQ